MTSAPDPLTLCVGEGRGNGVQSSDFKEENAKIFTCIGDMVKWMNPTSAESALSSDSAPKCSTDAPEGLNNAPKGLDSAPAGLTSAEHVQVLVTGSLHLVGATMSVLGCKVEDL